MTKTRENNALRVLTRALRAQNARKDAIIKKLRQNIAKMVGISERRLIAVGADGEPVGDTIARRVRRERRAGEREKAADEAEVNEEMDRIVAEVHANVQAALAAAGAAAGAAGAQADDGHESDGDDGLLEI